MLDELFVEEGSRSLYFPLMPGAGKLQVKGWLLGLGLG